MCVRWEIALTATVLLASAVIATSSTTEGDFAFDTDEILPRSNNDECSIRRLWGVPNMPAYAGRMFTFHIPKEAFSGKIAEYKVTDVENALPKWLVLDSRRGILKGVPTTEDIGDHRLTVTASSKKSHKNKCPPASDVFIIEVRDSKDYVSSLPEENRCHSEDETLLILYINEIFANISPKQRIVAISKLANFMGLNQSEFVIQPHQAKEKHSAKTNKHPSEIQIVVGCGGKLWHKHSLLVHQIQEQVKQGSISFITKLPINAWKLITHNDGAMVRKQRDLEPFKDDIEGSTADEDYDDDEDMYSGYDDDNSYDYNGPEVAPSTPPPTTPSPPTDPPHHHRHHHGETTLPQENINPEDNVIDYEEQQTQKSSTSASSTTEQSYDPITPEEFIPVESSSASTATTETLPITTPSSTPESSSEPSSPSPTPSEATESTTSPTSPSPSPPSSSSETPDLPIEPDSSPVTFATHSTLPVEDTTILVTDDIVTQVSTDISTTEKHINIHLPESSPSTEATIKQSSAFDVYGSSAKSDEPSSTIKSVSVDTVGTSEEEEIEFDPVSPTFPMESSPTDIVTTEHSITVVGSTTEDFLVVTNSPPQKQHRTKKIAVTAGKYFSYIIPEDLFIDNEDGTNLRLSMYDNEHTPLKSTSWVQFNSQTREVYGLPLEEHVSKWEYIIESTDSKNASATDILDITVQQHKGRRTVNHEFSMKLRIQEKYKAAIDWQIKVLKGLVSLFRDTDMDQITVRDVDIQSDPVEFIWTNDTLPKNYCPHSDISRLMGILQSNSDGEPSAELISTMSPELRVKSVTWKGTGPCQIPAPTPAAPHSPAHSDNYSPVPRNQIDHINATVGKLLVFKVPEDTFFDPEDGGAPNLKMWLTKGNGMQIPTSNWLQFDTKNQEFFGIPFEKDIGRADYQLVCEDSGGLTGKDILIVEVHPAPPFRPSIEFSLTLETHSNNFINSALLKRKFVDKLQKLYNDKDSSNIRIKSITDGPVVTWYNTSLSTDKCSEDEIKKLKDVLVRKDETLTERLDVTIGSDFPVLSVTINRKGACVPAGIPIVPDVPRKEIRPIDETSKTASSDDYIRNYVIPIAVIVCMLFIAALIACILYKRRRTGKMDMGDEEERQAFQSKGIPVIFQDELDEKPDSTNKSPIIMKEEKPPLLPPPEYKGMEGNSPTPSHTPYHPPPPFTASRDTPRNNRPKPSPAYRKPPPYVPP